MIELNGVSKSFQTKGKIIEAIQDVSLSVPEGQFVALIGPSGCGKSTILNMVAGLMDPTSGSVEYRGAPIDGVNTDVGYMTQKDSLLPWRTVAGNISAPLDIQGFGKDEKRRLVAEAIERVHLTGFEDHHPNQLSGGMRKRVLLARTLIYEPTTLLMDEPFGALDALLKLIMQEELLKIWRDSRRTVMYVTHDLAEAIGLADRIVVFSRRPGEIVLDQKVDIDRPRDLDTIQRSADFLDLHAELWSTLRGEVTQQQEQDLGG